MVSLSFFPGLRFRYSSVVSKSPRYSYTTLISCDQLAQFYTRRKIAGKADYVGTLLLLYYANLNALQDILWQHDDLGSLPGAIIAKDAKLV